MREEWKRQWERRGRGGGRELDIVTLDELPHHKFGGLNIIKQCVVRLFLLF